MKITGGQALVRQLIREGVTDIFGIPGVQLDWAVDALREHRDRIHFVVPRHEQAASYMADGYARTTLKEGVSLVVPGPGVLNALSGLATGYACSSRMLFISGQIPSAAIGKNSGLLHEIPNQSDILRSLTKWHRVVRKPQEISATVHQAFGELRNGHPRPVAIEIPPDVLQAKCEPAFFEQAAAEQPAMTDADVRQATEFLRNARFPVIHAGGGAGAARASEDIRALAEKLQAPVCMSQGGRGLVSDEHPLALTTLGERAVLPHADVVLVLGSRFLDALGQPAYQRDGCKFIYVNLDADHLDSPRQAGLALQLDVRQAVRSILAALGDYRSSVDRAADIGKVRAWQAHQVRQISPQFEYAEAIRGAIDDADIVVSELTQVGYFANIAMPVFHPRTYLTPGYQGTLGYGFPTSLGAAVGNPQRRVVSLTGDGGFGWGLQELATARRYRLDVTVIIFNDGRFGNVHRIQKRVFGETFASEIVNPDFVALATAFGIPAATVTSADELASVLRREDGSDGPQLVEVRVGEMASPWPLIHAFVPPASPPPDNPLGEPPGDAR